MIQPSKSASVSENLWDNFLRGDDKAFASIYFLHIGCLLSYGRNFTQDDEMLHDSVQEIFLDLFEKRGKPHAQIHNLKGYLLVALRNSILRKKLKQRKSSVHGLTSSEVEEFNVSYSFEEHVVSQEVSVEALGKLRQAIAGLSPALKEIVYLRFEEGLPYTEIAAIMEITVDSARKQLFRAISSLRNVLENQYFNGIILFILKKVGKMCP